MRFILVLCLYSALSFSADAQVQKLTKQLNTALDEQERIRLIQALGKTESREAVPTLCSLLKDGDLDVRLATIDTLGLMKTSEAKLCLKIFKGADSQSSARIDKVLGKKEVINQGALYLSVDSIRDVNSKLSPALMQLAQTTLKAKLGSLNASYAPLNEDRKTAENLVKSKGLKAYKLSLQITSNPSDKSMSVEMLVTTYPGLSLKGSWRVKAQGADAADLIEPMISRVVDDVSGELDWRR
jgi:hypothetical protein